MLIAMEKLLMKWALEHTDTCGTERQQNEIDGLVQERRNSSALAMELRLSCTNNPSKYGSHSYSLSLHMEASQ